QRGRNARLHRGFRERGAELGRNRTRGRQRRGGDRRDRGTRARIRALEPRRLGGNSKHDEGEKPCVNASPGERVPPPRTAVARRRLPARASETEVDLGEPGWHAQGIPGPERGKLRLRRATRRIASAS